MKACARSPETDDGRDEPKGLSVFTLPGFQERQLFLWYEATSSTYDPSLDNPSIVGFDC